MIILDDSSSSQEGDEGHYLSIGVTTSAGTSPSATPGDHIPTTDTQQARARNAISRRVKVDRSTSPNGEKDDEEYVPGGSDNPEDNNSKNSRYNLRPSRMTAKGQLSYDYEEGEEVAWEDSRHLMTSSSSTTPGKPSKTGKTRKRHKTKKEKQEKKERKRKEEENWKSQVAILQHQLNSLQHPQQQSPSYPHYQPQSLHQPQQQQQQQQHQGGGGGDGEPGVTVTELLVEVRKLHEGAKFPHTWMMRNNDIDYPAASYPTMASMGHHEYTTYIPQQQSPSYPHYQPQSLHQPQQQQQQQQHQGGGGGDGEPGVTVTELLVEVRKLHEGAKFPHTWMMRNNDIDYPAASYPTMASMGHHEYTTYIPQQQSPSYPHYQPQSLHQPLPLPQQHQQQPPPLPYPLHPTQYQPHMNLDELIYREEATFDNFVGSQLAYQPMPQHQMQQQLQQQQSPQQTHHLQQQQPPLQQPLQQDWQQQQLYNGYQAQPMSVGGEGRASLLGVEVGQPPQQTSTFRVKDTQDLLYSAG